MATLLAAKVRQERGSRWARRLRANGRIPAVLYGHGLSSVSLSVEGEEVATLLRRGAKGIVDLDIEGQQESVVIKQVQWDVFGRHVLHVDFSRVSRDERLKIEVPIVLRGTAPGVNEGGILEQLMRSIELECPADRIPDNVVIRVNHLALNQMVLVKELELGEGILALADPDQAVVQVRPPVEEAEAEEGAAGPAEPELIRKEKAEEEEE